MSDTYKARRGDLVAVVRNHRDYVIGQGAREHTSVTLGVVSNVTREGLIAAWTDGYGSKSWMKHAHRTTTLGAPQSRFSVHPEVIVTRAHFANCWHNGSPGKPFSSVEEAREFASQFIADAELVAS